MTSTTYLVQGMTCGHCVEAVRGELSALAGVADIEVSLVPGGVSSVIVRSEFALEERAVRAAVDEAGYQFVST